MNTSTLEAPVRGRQPAAPASPTRNLNARSATDQNRTAGARPAAPVRPARRSGRGTRPAARPARPLETPVVKVARDVGPRSCTVTAPVVAPVPVRPTASWRLTDRAIALVVVTGLVLVTAALAVVGLTAVRVTGERYHVPASSSVVSAPLAP